MAAASLAALTAETLLIISGRLTTLRDLAALTATTRKLHATLSPVLYQYGTRFYPDLLFQACANGVPGTVARLLPFTEDIMFHELVHVGSSSAIQDNDHGHEQQVSPSIWACLDERGLSKQQEESTELRLRPSAPKPCGMLATWDAWAHMIAQTERSELRLSKSPIHIAAVKGHVKVLQLLLQHDQGSSSIGSRAVGYCKPNRIHPYQMLDRGPRADAVFLRIEQRRERSIDTPLKAAICARQEVAARMLIDCGASLNLYRLGTSLERNEHVHALHLAARFGCAKIIRYLCSGEHSRGPIDINIRDSEGWTPLCHAIVGSGRDGDTVSCLLELGADINTPLDIRLDRDGFTPLHLACWYRQWLRASLLLAAGVDCDAMTSPHVEVMHTRTIGPARAIDIVCLEINKSLNETFTRDPCEALIESRCQFLVTLVTQYKASTTPCGRSSIAMRRFSPMAIAAANDLYHFELLSAFMKAGITFDEDTETICQALEVIHYRSLSCYRIDHQGVCAMVGWLFNHGAKLDHGDTARLFQVVINFMMKLWSGEEFQSAIDMLKLLVEEGRLDPNLSAIPSQTFWIPERWEVQNTKRWTLFRALLATNRLGEQHRPFLDQLIEYGAIRPTVLEVLRDFVDRLNPFSSWELGIFKMYKDLLAKRSKSLGMTGGLQEIQAAEDTETDSYSQAYHEAECLYGHAKELLGQSCIQKDHPHYLDQMWILGEQYDLITLVKMFVVADNVPTMEATYRALFDEEIGLKDEQGSSDQFQAVKMLVEMMQGLDRDDCRWASAGKIVLFLRMSRATLDQR